MCETMRVAELCTLTRDQIYFSYGFMHVRRYRITNAGRKAIECTVHGLDDGVTGGGEEIAQDDAQILLVLDDKNAFTHAAPAPAAARTGSSIRNVEP